MGHTPTTTGTLTFDGSYHNGLMLVTAMAKMALLPMAASLRVPDPQYSPDASPLQHLQVRTAFYRAGARGVIEIERGRESE